MRWLPTRRYAAAGAVARFILHFRQISEREATELTLGRRVAERETRRCDAFLRRQIVHRLLQRREALIAWLINDGHAPDVRCDFMQKFKPLAADLRLKSAKAGDVASGTSQALHETCANRIGHDDKHHRNSMRDFLQR